ncbi:MAG: hypothetical protein RBT76_05135 [candidate division Zixibacteria bacterium]|jgi:hypothetical protein|nr:hypothetical protein [candidate division Zixibacteria bacterium]
MKRQVPLFITFFVGTLLIVSVFSPPIETLGEDFSVFFDIIAVFAFFLGGGNLLRVHLTKISRRKHDWAYSIVTLVGFVVMLWAGLFKVWNEGGIAASVTAEESLFGMIFNSVLIPLQSTMYSLLAFFIASASYRAFRAKNREATILLVAAFIILLGRTAFGTMLTAWMPSSLSAMEIPNLAIWIMNSPNLAGQRAILIGIGLGVVSMSLRIILGVERTYLGDDGK